MSLAPAETAVGRAPVAFGALALVTVVHLATQLGDVTGPLAEVTQDLLMPLLALALALAVPTPRGRLVNGTLVALGFSFLGDAAPDLAPDDSSFLVMVGFFLVAQVAYVVTFWPLRRESVAGRSWLYVVPYAVAFVALVVACRAGAGSLFVPVVVYGLALSSMAVLSTGVSTLAGVGGAVFMASDALIALGEFTGLDLPQHAFWVMLTYVVGQTLIVRGVMTRRTRERTL
ncbi:lysoplasmalogenase [Monashia sp. NPDC004114]